MLKEMDTSDENQNASPEDLPWRIKDISRGPGGNQSVSSEDSPSQTGDTASTLEGQRSILPVDLPWRRTGTYRGRYVPCNSRDETNLPSKEERKKSYTCTREQEDMGYLEPVGKWMLSCDYITPDQNGLTELDKMWQVAKELWNEGIFYKVTCFTAAFSTKPDQMNSKVRVVSCFIPNYEDVERIILSASELRRRCIDMPYPFYFKTHRKGQGGRCESVLRYICCVDRDLYENYSRNNFYKWKLFKSSIC